jgi:putative flavoprotein involved in K+ transport
MTTCIDTVVIGAGHAGLAVSWFLTRAGAEHVLLDRGRIAERWRSERWDSLHLLTPNWMTRLPGWCYAGPDPDGYLSAADLVRHLEQYAASFGAPVQSHTTVLEVAATDAPGRARFRVFTDAGSWHARNVVVATGPHATPHVPAGLSGLSPRIEVVTSSAYRSPASLPPGGVLVVGASASGVQIADELISAGREVSVAVGRHTRMPRRYRGMDVFWWLEATGRLARTIDDVPDRGAARRETSLQLTGRRDPETRGRDLDLDLDLLSLPARGVRLLGRLNGVAGTTASFDADLAHRVAEADQKMNGFLDSVDRYVERVGLGREVMPAVRPIALDVADPVARLDLAAEGIGTVLVAAGYRPHHPWLHVPVLAADGSIRQHRGVTPVPGLYVVGQYFQHRRDSGFIDGARHDARSVVNHLLGSETSGPAAALTRARAA